MGKKSQQKKSEKKDRAWRLRGVLSTPADAEALRRQARARRGPVVYAVEEADHGPQLATLGVKRSAALTADYEADTWGGVVTLKGMAEREIAGDTLYAEHPAPREVVPLRAIPYAWWANRGEGEMRIWIREITRFLIHLPIILAGKWNTRKLIRAFFLK